MIGRFCGCGTCASCKHEDQMVAASADLARMMPAPVSQRELDEVLHEIPREELLEAECVMHGLPYQVTPDGFVICGVVYPSITEAGAFLAQHKAAILERVAAEQRTVGNDRPAPRVRPAQKARFPDLPPELL